MGRNLGPQLMRLIVHQCASILRKRQGPRALHGAMQLQQSTVSVQTAVGMQPSLEVIQSSTGQGTVHTSLNQLTAGRRMMRTVQGYLRNSLVRLQKIKQALQQALQQVL
jgi:hypothetical protein